ncbi:unnamed protein product [Prorocentrum cordatum]|uniref:Uncharacterized protein n=1 Tax=Prorocentrum cordatum TaxID=2364126 RepID=A0ABN9XMR4_9DINO|nr:unnamed protein product [Polarella glacialis]
MSEISQRSDKPTRQLGYPADQCSSLGALGSDAVQPICQNLELPSTSTKQDDLSDARALKDREEETSTRVRNRYVAGDTNDIDGHEQTHPKLLRTHYIVHASRDSEAPANGEKTRADHESMELKPEQCKASATMRQVRGLWHKGRTASTP